MTRGAHITCAATGCCVHVERGKLMCRDHWFALDDGLRREIGHRYRAGHWGAYHAAVARAVAQLEAAEQRFTGIFEPRANAPRARLALGRGHVSRPPFVVPADGGVAI